MFYLQVMSFELWASHMVMSAVKSSGSVIWYGRVTGQSCHLPLLVMYDCMCITEQSHVVVATSGLTHFSMVP